MRAGLTVRAGAWPWSSAQAHLAGQDDGLVAVAPLLERVPDWKKFLLTGVEDAPLDALRRHSRTGHPLGGDGFYAALARILGRDVRPRRRGRPGKTVAPAPFDPGATP